MTIALIMAAFAMGFFGSPHCLGMCGGIVTAFGMSMQTVSPHKKNALIATYHFGRLLSYAALGVIAGLLGMSILAPLMQDHWLRILLGLVLVFVGLTMLGMPWLNQLEKMGMGLWQRLSPLRQKVFPLDSFAKALSAGLLWGFLPCGLVYGALMVAVVGHDVATGAALMFAFGLGTVPMLVMTDKTVAFLKNHISRLKLRQVNGMVMMIAGVAVVAVPIAMKQMHGGHGGGHTDASSLPHASHQMSQNQQPTSHTQEAAPHSHDAHQHIHH